MRPAGPPAPARWQLVVDPIRCQAHGLCAQLLPESVDLDEWGYPMLADVINPLHLEEARAAVAGCPTLALRLVRQATVPRPS